MTLTPDVEGLFGVLQARELDDLAAKGRELRARIKELTEAVEMEQAANALVTDELQVRDQSRVLLLAVIVKLA